MSEGFASFREFYPFYLGEHRDRTCRRLHFVGTSFALGFIVLAIVRAEPRWLLAALASGYAFAWYGHLKYRTAPLAAVILVSWGIAFFEYCLMVPANRIGAAVYSAPQLKGMQEVITLLVFAGFSFWYLGQPLKWNHWAGFALIAVAAWLIFLD